MADEVEDRWGDGLTPDALEEIIHKAIAARDFKTVGAALAVLAVRSPERAVEIRTVLQAGIILGRRRLAAEGAMPAESP